MGFPLNHLSIGLCAGPPGSLFDPFRFTRSVTRLAVSGLVREGGGRRRGGCEARVLRNFGVCFNVSVDGVPWPRHLRSLKFGGHFNQSLEGVTLPDTLESLTFGHRFDQSLDGVNLPHSLQSLTFDNYFNQSLNGVTLPSNLQHLTFGNEFNQSLEQVTFPEHLQSLTFGDDFDQSLEQVVWPSNLKSLTLGQHFNQSLLKDGTLPTTLLRLDLKGLILSAEGRENSPSAPVVHPPSCFAT